MKIEWWRYINGFVGLYMVSTLGRVKSFDYNHTGKEYITYGSFHKANGYMRMYLYKNGKRFEKRIHRLVARAFPEICGKWFKGCHVNHKNEIKTDNRAENLEICSASYNCNYGTRNERISKTKIEKGIKGKPTLQYSLDGDFIARFKSARQAANIVFSKEYMQAGISKCCRGEQSTAGGFVWKYE